MGYLEQDDPRLAQLVRAEEARLENTLDLIAAENHSPPSVMEITGSAFNTKTIEGYPGNRFHAGCVHADQVEQLAVERGQALFNAEHVNVQPHSGTSANLAVYFSALDMGDPILSMSLPHGGHLSHGHQASITSKCFDFSHYTVDPDTGRLDYDQIREMALKLRPKMIVAGASSYPRLIDYKTMGEIARETGALLMADIAHLAGLVAAGVIPSPVPHCDFVTLTCYKTMMGGRGGVILARKEFGPDIDRAVFPGCQGTSPVNMMAAKALSFKLAQSEKFIDIQRKTLENAKALSKGFIQKGYTVVTGGTDNHQVILDLESTGITGKEAEAALESAGIILNRNVVPRDAATPGRISGIRIGTSAVAARGMTAPQMEIIAGLMDRIMGAGKDKKEVVATAEQEVLELCRAFPVYTSA